MTHQKSTEAVRSLSEDLGPLYSAGDVAMLLSEPHRAINDMLDHVIKMTEANELVMIVDPQDSNKWYYPKFQFSSDTANGMLWIHSMPYVKNVAEVLRPALDRIGIAAWLNSTSDASCHTRAERLWGDKADVESVLEEARRTADELRQQ